MIRSINHIGIRKEEKEEEDLPEPLLVGSYIYCIPIGRRRRRKKMSGLLNFGLIFPLKIPNL